MPVASSTVPQTSYQSNRNIVNSNRYNSGYSSGLGYEPCSGTVNNQVSNYMALDKTTNIQTQNSNKTENFAPSSVLMRYNPQALHTTVQTPSVYPVAAPSQQVPCLCVPFLDSIAVNQVNMNCLPSQDTAGKDLPEMNTLRFFFNLGVENYRAVCNGGQYWSLMDFTPVGVPSIDQQNGNMCGYQFTAPPPPIPKGLPAANDNEVQSRENVNQNSYQPAYHSFQGEVYKNPKEAVGAASLTPTSEKKGSQSDKMDNVSVDCNDSGCDSDSISGSAHDDSFKENSEKEKAPVSPTLDLKRNIDSFIAKSDEQITTDADSTTAEFQVPSTTKPRTKRKYYMYGNHKLIKPVKDIPPRFLSLLAENSAARARCEGEPIIIPFLPPRYNRYNRNHYHVANGNNNAVTGFNPDAKCFVPGQTVPNDPSIIACSTTTDPTILAYSSMSEQPSLVDTNTTNGTQKYFIPYPPPNTLYVPSSGSLQSTNPCTNTVVGVGCHKVTGDGSAYKSSMPSSSSAGASQPCAQQYGATMQSVYYAPTASYQAFPQGCLAGAQAMPAYTSFVPNASQTYSMPAHVAQIASVQAAQ